MRYAEATAGATANNATTAGTAIATPDDNFTRVLQRIWVTPQTAGIQIVVRKAGFQVAQFDAARCAAGNWPVEIGETFPPLIQFTFDVVNASGGSVTVTAVAAYSTPSGANNPAGYPTMT